MTYRLGERSAVLAMALILALLSEPGRAQEDADSVRVVLDVPETGLLYVRYGPPGGVRIIRGGRPDRGTAPETRGTETTHVGPRVEASGPVVPGRTLDDARGEALLQALRRFSESPGPLRAGPDGRAALDPATATSPAEPLPGSRRETERKTLSAGADPGTANPGPSTTTPMTSARCPRTRQGSTTSSSPTRGMHPSR